MVSSPFEVRGGTVRYELERTIENAQRDGIRVSTRKAGSQSAGQIGFARNVALLAVLVGIAPKQESVMVPLRYELLLNCRDEFSR